MLKLILTSELGLKKMQLGALGDYRGCAGRTQNWMVFPAALLLNHEPTAIKQVPNTLFSFTYIMKEGIPGDGKTHI